jgi:type I restriction enzyme S subunit
MTSGALADIGTPDGWGFRPLWAVAPRVVEKGFPQAEPLSVFLGDGVVPRSQRADNHNELGADLSAYQRVLPGDLVFNKLRTWQGGLGISAHEGIVSPAYFVCRPDASVWPKYLHYLLLSAPYRVELTRLSKWMPPSQFDIPWEMLRTLPLLLPPMADQRRVADFLDEQVAVLDRATALRQQQMALVEEQFQARREEVIENRRDSTRVPLGLLVDPARPINYGVLMPGPRLEEGVPLIEAGDAMRGPIDIARLRLTDPAIEAEFRRSRLRAGDLVMAIRGSVGRVQLVPSGPEIMNVTRDAARISLVSTAAHAPFVRHALATRHVQDWLRLRLTGSAVTGINIGDLRKVPVAVSPLRDQVDLATMLDEWEQRLWRTLNLLQESSRLLAERKQALITTAVLGQFDVTTARSAA